LRALGLVYKLSANLVSWSSFSNNLVKASVSTNFSKAGDSIEGIPVVGRSPPFTAFTSSAGFPNIAFLILKSTTIPAYPLRMAKATTVKIESEVEF
jgi:hypothetical protein